MPSRINDAAHIRHNEMVHDAVAHAYEKAHMEIYNPTEQSRLADALTAAIGEIRTGRDAPSVLDFGAGTGNLTGHLLSLGMKVTAADVSSKSLAALQARFPNAKNLELLPLNGLDLSNIGDKSLDMVATYSVLHHVPDYLGAVKEFQRVVRPGGIIFIDHEAASHVWNPPPELHAYQEAYERMYGLSPSQKLKRKFLNLFSLPAWRRQINQRFFGLHPEGDIHVTHDDHIDWQAIKLALAATCDIITDADYLLCRERSADVPLYVQYRGKITDMHLLVVRKR